MRTYQEQLAQAEALLTELKYAAVGSEKLRIQKYFGDIGRQNLVNEQRQVAERNNRDQRLLALIKEIAECLR